MKLATTTGDFNIFGQDHESRIKSFKETNFKYIDLDLYTIDKSQNGIFMRDGWQDYVLKLKRLAEELGLTFCQAHSPVGNPLEQNGFEEYLNSTIRSIEICGMLGIKNTVVHAGWANEIGKDEYFSRNHEFYSQLFPVMEKCNVNVLIENSAKCNFVDYYYFFDGKEMHEFLDYVNHPLLNACWDTGHANVEGHHFDDILCLSDRLKAVHINDNYGFKDQHIAPFMGTLNIDEVMTALTEIGFNGFFTFESSDTIRNGRHSLPIKQNNKTKENKLQNPPPSIHIAKVNFLYEIGKAILKEYGVFEI